VYNGALTTFDSLIYESFGFTNLEVILFSMPTYALTFTMIIGMGFVVYYFPGLRFPVALASQAIVAFVLFFTGLANVGKWAKWAVFMWSIMDTVATFVMAWPVISINVAGRTKKAFFGASSLISYCVGNLVGAQIMRPSDAPRYTKGLTAAAVILIANIVLTANWWWYYVRENRKRRAENAGMTEEERVKQAEVNGVRDLTDRQNRQFVYMC
jgi:cbb3-type cytochrome oxidase subunit 3